MHVYTWMYLYIPVHTWYIQGHACMNKNFKKSRIFTGFEPMILRIHANCKDHYAASVIESSRI